MQKINKTQTGERTLCEAITNSEVICQLLAENAKLKEAIRLMVYAPRKERFAIAKKNAGSK